MGVLVVDACSFVQSCPCKYSTKKFCLLPPLPVHRATALSGNPPAFGAAADVRSAGNLSLAAFLAGTPGAQVCEGLPFGSAQLAPMALCSVCMRALWLHIWLRFTRAPRVAACRQRAMPRLL